MEHGEDAARLAWERGDTEKTVLKKQREGVEKVIPGDAAGSAQPKEAGGGTRKCEAAWDIQALPALLMPGGERKPGS